MPNRKEIIHNYNVLNEIHDFEVFISTLEGQNCYNLQLSTGQVNNRKISFSFEESKKIVEFLKLRVEELKDSIGLID